MTSPKHAEQVQTPPSESAVACAREIMKGAVSFTKLNGSRFYDQEKSATIIQRFADAQATGGGTLLEALCEIREKCVFSQKHGDDLGRKNTISAILSVIRALDYEGTPLPSPAIASPVRSAQVQAAIDSAEALPPFNWAELRAYIAQLEVQACAGAPNTSNRAYFGYEYYWVPTHEFKGQMLGDVFNGEDKKVGQGLSLSESAMYLATFGPGYFESAQAKEPA